MIKFSLRAFLPLFVFLSISSVYAQTKVVVIPLSGDAPAPIEYAIGDTGPAGGVVFHTINGGLNGLEAATVDQGTAPFCVGVNVVGVEDNREPEDSNSGAANTPLIAVQCPGAATNAAVFAAVYVWPNGETGGFLPNIEELNLLYLQKNTVGGFVDSAYWSSTEADISGTAWGQNFDGGDQGVYIASSGTLNIRTVRAF